MADGYFTKPIKWKRRRAHRVKTNSHFTKPIKWKPRKAHRGKTEIVTDDNGTNPSAKTTRIVKGAPVKITRAQDGSRGKDTKVELVEKPKGGNWLDTDMLNDPGTLHGRQSGFGRWAERIAVPLEQIDKTEVAGTLSEMLASEEVIIQNAAEKKLRELEDKNSKEEAPKTRFDVIDILDEEKKD
jgi:hypothetical protein